MRQQIYAYVQEHLNKGKNMKNVIILLGGVVIGVVIGLLTFLDRQQQISAVVSQAQGRVDVMQFFCKKELEAVGIINKEKKDVK